MFPNLGENPLVVELNPLKTLISRVLDYYKFYVWF